MTELETSTAAMLDGRYLLGECIGQGGMARVFRAEDVQLGRTVAIKMLRADADTHATPERARMEMALLASLNHPSLVTLFDASIVPGKPEYLVMEFVDGASLAEELSAGPMAAAEVAAIAAELAAALHVVHDAGIVHRDIKPSNVLLAPTALPGRRHRAKLADFGVAYLADSTRLTSPGLIIGTAAYLAPEQVRGEPAGPPVDIYALGLMLLEALTGHRAFPHASGIGAVMTRLIEEPDIPEWMGPDWTALLRSMTATDPAARPTALAVLDAVSGLPLAIGPAPASVAAADGELPETVPLALPGGVPTGAPLPAAPASAPVAAAPASAPVATDPPPMGDTTSAPPPARRPRGRRAAVLLPLAAAGALLCIQVGMWVGGMQLQSEVAPVVGPTPSPSVSTVQEAVTEDEVQPILPAGDTRESVPTVPDRSAKDAAKDARDGAREAEKAARESEKMARDAQKAEETATREAAKEQAARQRDAEKAAKKGG